MNKTIAIWAPLRYANVGDDMQALAFAMFIKKQGYEVKLYQLEESLSVRYGLKSVQTLDELCQDVNLCVIAGGALLTPFKWYKRLLNRAAREYEQDFKNLLAASKKYPRVKFCAISMGGDGKVKDPVEWYSKYRIDFFKSPSFIDGTVRLAGDVEQMKQFGKHFTFFPDMLFRQEDFFKKELLPPSSKYRVVLQFKRGRYLDKQLLKDIMAYASTNDDMEFHFITTHMPQIGLTYQYVPEKASKNIFIDTYQNPEQLIGILASADVLMTSMLHVGLIGLTCGTPFVSYRGPGKTKSFLMSVGGDWAILDDNLTFDEIHTQVFSKNKNQLFSQYDRIIIEEMKAASCNHYDFCKNILEKYA